jgi:hypothetical protein
VLSEFIDGVVGEDESALMKGSQVKKGSIAAQFLRCGTRHLTRIGNESALPTPESS